MSKFKTILIILMIGLSLVGTANAGLTIKPSGNFIIDFFQKLSLQTFDQYPYQVEPYTDAACSQLSIVTDAYGSRAAPKTGQQYAELFYNRDGIVFGGGYGSTATATIKLFDKSGRVMGSKDYTVDGLDSRESIRACVPITIPESMVGYRDISISFSATTSTYFSELQMAQFPNAVVSSTTTPQPSPTPTPTTTTTPTPTVTQTPPPTIPPPTIIPPELSRLIDLIWSMIKSFFGLLSISGGQSVFGNINTPYSTMISLSFVTPIDADYSDGTYQIKKAEWFVVDENKNVLHESGWSGELTTSPWTATASYTPTNYGRLYLIGIVVNQKYTYTSGAWAVTESIETKEVQEINVAPPVIPQPISPISDIINMLISWLKGLFSWLPW